MLGWIHTDEDVEPIPNWGNFSQQDLDFHRTVPWRDDGRFLCPYKHWVRTGFSHCPICNCSVRYKHNVADAYMSDIRAIPWVLWYPGLRIRIHD